MNRLLASSGAAASFVVLLGAVAACSGSKGDTGATGETGPAGPAGAQGAQGVPGRSTATTTDGGTSVTTIADGGSSDASTADASDAGPPVTASLTFSNAPATPFPQTVYSLSFGGTDTLNPPQTVPSNPPVYSLLSVQVAVDENTSHVERNGSAGIPLGTATLTLPATANEAATTITFANAYLKSYADIDERIGGTPVVTLNIQYLSFAIPTTCTAIPGPYAVADSAAEIVASGAIRASSIQVAGSQPVTDTTATMGTGTPSLQGITIGLPLESQVGCVAKYLINGNGEQPKPTEFDVAASTSTTTQTAGDSTTTYDLCGPVVTGLSISGAVGSLVESITFNGGGLVTTSRGFDSDGGVTANAFGWNYNTNASITACP